jgi:heme oxygenase
MQVKSFSRPTPITGDRAATPMQRLRQATRSAHERIELALPLFDPSLTRASYIRVLESFHGFYAPLELLCERVAGPVRKELDLASRAKTPLLVTDLGAMGRTPADLLALRRCRALPKVTLASHATGVLYVLEGATLGGEVIARHLRGALGIDASSGAAFFSGYGAQTRVMWMRFAAYVDGAAGLDLDDSIAAANGTFAALERWLTVSMTSQ